MGTKTYSMEKTMHLIVGSGLESYESFSDRILNLCRTFLTTDNPSHISVVLTQSKPPALSVIPYKRKKIASVSVVADPEQATDFFRNQEGWRGSYLVTEAVPVGYEKNWPDGEITPGVCLLTLFRRKKGIDRSVFLDRWHKSHTPLSLRIHPLWDYNRNVVEKYLKEDSAKFEGIVEEQVRTAAELFNPFKFFGPFPKIFARMLLVYTDTKSFIEYPTMETYLTREYVIKSS